MTSGLSPTRAPTTTATAVLLATARAEGGGPAALQPWGDATILERVIAQLARLGVRAVHVITRPEWEGALPITGVPEHDVTTGGEPAQGITPIGVVRVHVSPDPAEDLRTIAEIARGGTGRIVVALGDVVMHDSALANVLERPRPVTAALTTARTGPAGRFAPRVRERRGQVLSAGSPYHSVRKATGSFLGVVCVSPADRPALADVAERLAGLAPPEWEEQFERKADRWRSAPHGELQIAAAREDVASLLVTGLVRSRVHVVAAHLNRLFWARPLSREAVDKAAERIERIDEDRLVLDSAVKTNDGFFTTFFVSPYSRFIARWCARRGFTPNQVTTASLLLGVLAAAGFATGERWAMIAAAVVLQFSFTLDCVDGQLARYTRRFSRLGAWLDSIFDRTKEYAVFAGLAIGAAANGDGVWLLAGCAIALQTVRHMIYVSFRDAQHRVFEAPQPPIEQPSDRLGAPKTIEVDEPEPAPEHEPLPRRAPSLLHRISRVPVAGWVRKMIPFPIGERFAAISITAASSTPRVTFVVLLAWGGVAAAYTFTGRVLRSLA